MQRRLAAGASATTFLFSVVLCLCPWGYAAAAHPVETVPDFALAVVTPSDPPLPAVPPPIAAAAVYRIDLAGAPNNCLPIFRSDMPDVIADFVAVYNAGRTSLVVCPPALPDEGGRHYVRLLNVRLLTVLLVDRTELSLLQRQDGATRVWFQRPGGDTATWVLSDRGLYEWLGTVRSLFPRGEPLKIEPSCLVRCGETVTISAQGLPEADLVKVYLGPYAGVEMRREPVDCPLPDAALVAAERPVQGRISVKLHLRGAIGRRPDGSHLDVVPGAYHVYVVVPGRKVLGRALTILPPAKPPRVVGVRGSKVAVWSSDRPLTINALAPGEGPRRVDVVDTYCNTRFFAHLGFPVTYDGKAARVDTGGGEMLIAGVDTDACVNGTVVWRWARPPVAAPGGLGVCFTPLMEFLEYDVYWLANDAVFFLHQAPEVPCPLLAALGYLPAANALVLVNGLPVGGEALWVDGAVYVPGEDLARAARGGTWYGEVDKKAHFEGPFGEVIVWGTAIEVNGREIAQRAAFKDGRFYLPLRSVGEALGGTVTWDGSQRLAELRYQPREPLP